MELFPRNPQNASECHIRVATLDLTLKRLHLVVALVDNFKRIMITIKMDSRQPS